MELFPFLEVIGDTPLTELAGVVALFLFFEGMTGDSPLTELAGVGDGGMYRMVISFEEDGVGDEVEGDNKGARFTGE